MARVAKCAGSITRAKAPREHGMQVTVFGRVVRYTRKNTRVGEDDRPADRDDAIVDEPHCGRVKPAGRALHGADYNPRQCPWSLER